MAAGGTVNQPEVNMPSYWRLLWMLLMQPSSLYSALKSAGVSNPDDAGWILWQQGGTDRAYAKKAGALLGSLPTGTVVIVFIIARICGLGMDLEKALVGVAWTLVLGIALGASLSITLGVAGGLVLGTLGSVAASFGWHITPSILSGSLALILLSLFQGFIYKAATLLQLRKRKVVGMGGDIALSITGVIGWCLAANTNSYRALAVVILVVFRFPLTLLEALAQTSLYLLENFQAPRLIRFSPVLYHEMSFLTHPFLARHIIRVAEANPALAQRVLEACAIAPGQRQVRIEVLEKLQASELVKATREQEFGALAKLQGTWLYGIEGADPLLQSFAEVARYLASTEETTIPYHRLQKLERASLELRALRRRLFEKNGHLAQVLRTGPLPVWEEITAELRRAAEVEIGRAHV